jgi:hypothetical protein
LDISEDAVDLSPEDIRYQDIKIVETRVRRKDGGRVIVLLGAWRGEWHS